MNHLLGFRPALPMCSAANPRLIVRRVAGMAFNFSATDLSKIRVPRGDDKVAPSGFNLSESGLHYLRAPSFVAQAS